MKQKLESLKKAREEAQALVDAILARYDGGGMFSSGDSSDQDYYEGQVVAYDYAIQLLEEGQA